MSALAKPECFEPLQQQLINRFTERHDKFFLSVPPGADYVFVKYPPTPVSPYSGSHIENIVLPSSGTYRLANGDKRSLGRSARRLPVFHIWASGSMPILRSTRASQSASIT